MIWYLNRQSILITILFILLGAFCPTCISRTIHVSPDSIPDGSGTTWETAYHTISAGLAASASGDEIWVQANTYPESIVLQTGVALYGGFTGHETKQEDRDYTNNKTIIDASDLNTSVVIGADDAILDGFTITGGFTYNGGGLYCTNASLTLNNCIIKSNRAYSLNYDGGNGGGIYCINSSLILNNCIISNNSALVVMDEYDEFLYGGSGGGLCGIDSTPELKNCSILNNEAYNIRDYHGNGYHLYDEFGSGGGISCEKSSPILYNCVIAGNESIYGGGVYCNNDATTIINCTFVGNSGIYFDLNWGGLYEAGSGIYCKRGNLVLMNSILRNELLEISGPGSMKVSYCNIEGGWSGVNNIDGDPMFIHPWTESGADLRLQPGSPCIDAGSPDVSFNDGCLPPGLGGVRNDMGAYGGPGNCMGVPGIPTPTFTPTETATPTNTPSPTSTPTPTFTPLPGQPIIWVLDGQGTVQILE